MDQDSSANGSSRVALPEPGSEWQQTPDKGCEAGHCTGHGLRQWVHETDRQTDTKQRMQDRKKELHVSS